MTNGSVHDRLPAPLRNVALAMPALDGARRDVQLCGHRTDAAELLEDAHGGVDPSSHGSHIYRTYDVRQSHYDVRDEFRTYPAMDSAAIIEGLRRLGVPHDDIAEVIGRDRTAATKMLAGRRNVQAREIEPLMQLIAKYERAEGLVDEPTRTGYVEVEVLPTYAGAGGGGNGDADRRVSLVSATLVRDELHAKPTDLLLIDVRGDSMEPDFHQGDQILIDKRDRDPRQPGPFALWDDDGYVIKLVERVPRRRGWYRVFSANPRYRDYEVEEKETTIMGRPVWFARRL